MRRLLPLTLLILWAAPASAYVTEKASGSGVELRWTALPMKFNVHQSNPPGLSATEWQGAIKKSYQTWSDVTCSYFTASDQGVVSLPTGNDGDQINSHVFRSSWPSSFGGNALGITQTKYDPYSGKILDADTHYNPNYSWSVSGSAWDIDAQSVATHEIGHQLGLDHSQYQSATMFYATGQGDTTQRSLDSDDIDGICHLYPSGSTPPPECTTATDCAPSETCQSGKCVTATAKGYGSTCNTSKECTSQLCLSDGTNFFCSEMCSTSDPCPNSDQCLPLQDGGSACLPGSATWGTKDLGQPCQSTQDCKQTPKMFCVSVPGKGYLCASMCDLTKNDCTTGYTCTSSNIGGLCIPGTSTNPTPPPTTKKKLGETCTTSTDCQSSLCAQTGAGMVCVQYCNDTDNFCPSGFKCVPAGNMKVCIADSSQPAQPQPGALGASCTKHEDCDSNLCGADAAGNRFCTELCDPSAGCASGYECVPAGGSQYACSPSATTNPADGGGGGCAVRGGEPAGGGGRWLLLILALPLVLFRRRR